MITQKHAVSLGRNYIPSALMKERTRELNMMPIIQDLSLADRFIVITSIMNKDEFQRVNIVISFLKIGSVL
ncbi:hypothetical protein D3C81_1725050 [compost metagenome]